MSTEPDNKQSQTEPQIEELSTPSESEKKDASESEKAPSDAPRPFFPEDFEPSGGPLGCCLGSVIGLMVFLMLTVGLSLLITNRPIQNYSWLFPLSVLGAIVCGFIGWRIGKRVYREYDPPVIKQRPPRRARPRSKRA